MARSSRLAPPGLFVGLRKVRGPVAILLYATLFLTMTPVRPARAGEPPAPVEAQANEPGASHALTEGAQKVLDTPHELPPVGPAGPAAQAPTLAPGAGERSASPSLESAGALAQQARQLQAQGTVPIAPVAGPTPPSGPPKADNLPTGGDKTGVSSQAISVPQGAGKIQGMGESFSAQLSTGIATFSVPISLPAARGAAQPSLGLSYSSSGGHGLAGVGWEIGVPYIARQTDRGLPTYLDPNGGTPWDPNQDRFVFNGGQELVPICLVQAGSLACAGALKAAGASPDLVPQDEQMPAWSGGWRYFRPRVEGSFQRFFWSPNHKSWRVQDKSGVMMELGVPLDGSGSSNALETSPTDPSHIFRWNLSRQYDAQVESPPPATGAPRPVNLVVYRYTTSGGVAYLSDLYDTPPAASSADAPLSTYAHHTRLVYETRPDITVSYRRGWPTQSTLRLKQIDVASKSFTGVGDPRGLVRRYHLTYDPAYHPSLLSNVQIEGRCADTDQPVAETEDSAESLPTSTSCPRLPAMTFGYQHVTPYQTDGSPGTADLVGYEGFDERVISLQNSPDHSLDDDATGLFDVNADGLPDVVVTLPGLYSGRYGLFLNGSGGLSNSFVGGTMCLQGVNGDNATVVSLNNPNVNPLDLDGDGIIDWLHMPKVQTYSVYTPQKDPSCGGSLPWTWVGRSIPSASQLNPKIDFGQDANRLRVFDVNGDGLVDVVRSTGTSYQTFFSLGRYAGGDGQFGHASWTGPTSATLSDEPVAHCVPWSGSPVQFDDPDVQLADMNGDGLTDIVRIRQGDMRYWPGRGNGLFGTGNLDDCPGDSFGQDRSVAMTTSPQYADPNGSGLRLDDVNGDGLDDLVQVRFDAVDVWLNVDGTGWTPTRHIIANTPTQPDLVNRVRLVDINGSGTRDILWGDGLKYRYIDLAGGQRPWVLTEVANGLGKTTELTYASSTELMLAAEKAGHPWTTLAPMPLHVVVKSTEKDHLELVGRPAGTYVTKYQYQNPVYDGRQREFRGFQSASATRLGDGNSPTSIASSRYLLGSCEADPASPGMDLCSPANRWRDNPREALKGLPVASETSDEKGVFLSSVHHTYRLRQLYQGLDGRAVNHAFESGSDSYTYETSPFVPASGGAPLPPVDVERELSPGAVTSDTPGSLVARSMQGTVHLHSEVTEDVFGNRVEARNAGCQDGCPAPDETLVSRTVPGRPAGDSSGWRWRTVESYASGSLHPAPRHHSKTTYDALGQPTAVYAALSGSLPLQRRHEPGTDTAVAPAPPEASTDTGNVPSLLQGQTTYDAFGQSTFSHGPNGRCRRVSYGSDPYAALPSNETVLVGAASSDPGKSDDGCGSLPLLAAVTSYDRGLGMALTVHDLHGETTHARYDGLGRLLELHRPDLVTGQPGTVPSVKVEYLLTTDGAKQPYSLLHTQTETQDGDTLETSKFHQSWGYVDGLGRTVITLVEADPGAGDAGAWIASGLSEYDAKGAAERAYLAWFYDGDPQAFPLTSVPPGPYGRQRYDAFGRQLQTFGLDGTVSLQTRYHPLAMDAWDAADLSPGPHQGTYASTRKDGHGRSVDTTERVHVGGALEEHHTLSTYLATGEVETVTRRRGADTASQVVRWMRYDTLGRMVLNVEPNTSSPFTPDPTADPDSLHAWRYAYSDAGDLVGTSDARGCGSNYHYDRGGRLLAEDYSPCLNAHLTYSAPDLVSGTGTEVFYRYDLPDPEWDAVLVSTPQTPENGPKLFSDSDAPLFLGRVSSVADRGSKVLTRYDLRGRITAVAKRVAAPGPASEDLGLRYAPHWYVQEASFDAADRPVAQSTGADIVELAGSDGKSIVRTSYTGRGTVRNVAGSYGPLVASVVRDADGLPQSITYGDLAKTSTVYTYDDRRRTHTVQTSRGPPEAWTTPPPGYQPAPIFGGTNAPSTFPLLLEDLEYSYDNVDNPTEIRDWRIASEWPTGAKPVSRTMEYDDLFRLSRIEYKYEAGQDGWVSPFDAENQGQNADPRRALPSPHVAFDKRVLNQRFAYDWLGNTTSTDDDAHGFYDRSLGALTNGGAMAGPYQLKAASNSAAGGARQGSLSATYDEAGYLTTLAVNRAGPCLPAGALCNQRFAYDWDEAGRLVRARRWDGAASLLSDPALLGPAAVELRHSYDGGDQRVLKTAVDGGGNELHTVYVFGSLELRRAAWVEAQPSLFDFQRTNDTEVASLDAHGMQLARLVTEPSGSATLPGLTGSRLHVLLELADHLGSTSVVLDQATSELAEAATYQAYGGAESDHRPGRWGAFREDYRFTGKEEDVEVGLQYFGKRFYAPLLGRWVSADPLTIHGLGADLNAYTYVHGAVLRASDPTGLDAVNGTGGAASTEEARSSMSGPAPQSDTAEPICSGSGPQCTGQSYLTSGLTSGGGVSGEPADGATQVVGGLAIGMTNGMMAVANAVQNPRATAKKAAIAAAVVVVPGGVMAAGVLSGQQTGKELVDAAMAGTLPQYLAEGVGEQATFGVLTEGAGALAKGAAALVPALREAALAPAFMFMGTGGLGGGSPVGATATRSGKEIALGLSSTTNHSPGLLARFAKEVGALHSFQWEDAGLADARNFPDMFYEATAKADKIHFNLSGLEGIEAGVPFMGRPGLEPITGQTTMGELSAVLHTPRLLAKTVFYENGVIRTPPQRIP